MATNEGVTNRRADDATLCSGRRSTKYFGAADWRWIFVLGSYFYFIIFSVLITASARGITFDDTKAAG